MSFEACEWNPAADRAAKSDEEPHAEAVLCVGHNGAWHLCRACAELPRFKRFRSRHKLKAFDNPTPGAPQG